MPWASSSSSWCSCCAPPASSPAPGASDRLGPCPPADDSAIAPRSPEKIERLEPPERDRESAAHCRAPIGLCRSRRIAVDHAILAPEPVPPPYPHHGRDLLDPRAESQPPARLHRTALARPCGVLRHRRLYLGAARAQGRVAVRRRLRRRR